MTKPRSPHNIGCGVWTSHRSRCGRLPTSSDRQWAIWRVLQEVFRQPELHLPPISWSTGLGTTFLQFPPELGPQNWRHLQSLLKLLPKEFQVSIELRHPAWFEKEKGLEWLFRLGEDLGVSIAITDVAGRRDVLHQCFPQSNAFIRFSGDELVTSDFERLADWSRRLRELLSRGISEVYFILHQQQEGNCVELAEHFQELMPDAQLPTIERVGEQKQLQLW